MASNFKILSYNVASNKLLSGLLQLMDIFNPHLIFIQEITLSTCHLNSIVGPFYEGICNIDGEDSRKPGNACIWLKGMQVRVNNIIPCRLQTLYSIIIAS